MIALKLGDPVAYSASFLRSIGCFTGEIPAARGKIEDLEPVGRTNATIAKVKWDNPNIPAKVLTSNLALVGSSAMAAS